jgi:hypothetical protein
VQNWADNFISELNDTHIEADLRLRHAPPPVGHTCVTPDPTLLYIPLPIIIIREPPSFLELIPPSSSADAALLPTSLLSAQLEMQDVVRGYDGSSRRLIVLGYNATLTTT